MFAVLAGFAAAAVDIGALSTYVAYGMALGVLAWRILSTKSAGGWRYLPADRPFLLLLCWGTAGSLLGRMYEAQNANALPFFIAMLLGLAHIIKPLDLASPQRARRITVVLTNICSVYVALSFLTTSGRLPFLRAEDFLHTRAFFIAMALAGAILLRRWLLFCLLTAGTIGIFIGYPALTYVLVGITALGVGLIGVLRGWNALIATVVVLGAVLFFLPYVTDVTAMKDSYFESVGKVDNTRARHELLSLGLSQVRERPVFGTGFTSDLAVVPPLGYTGANRIVPVHNDYVQFAMGGGLVGVSLLVLWLLLSLVSGIRLSRLARAEGRPDEGRLALLLTIGIATICVTAFFNPILIDAQNSFSLAIIYDLLASLVLTRERQAKR